MLLALLAASAEQDYKLISIFSEINSISRPEVDTVFHDSGANAFHVREITKLDAGQGCCDSGGGRRVEAIEPIGERATAALIQILPAEIAISKSW